jgi:hypothetical protein
LAQQGVESFFDTWNYSRMKYYINTYNLYHKHSFEKEKALETTFRFNLNGHQSSGERQEIYDNLPVYENMFDYDNYRLSSSLDINYSFGWKGQSSNIGSQTRYNNDRIRQIPLPAFRYRALNEYIYADTKGTLSKKFSYVLSLGADVVFNRSQEVTNQYVRPSFSLSADYRFNTSQSLNLSYRLSNDMLDIRYLNPYTTSTDSLYRSMGNPYLQPARRNTFSINYSLNKNGFYVAPRLSYRLIRDYIVQSGSTQGNIYTQTYINEGHYKEWDGYLTLRYNNRKWGNIGGSAGYRHSYYTEIDRGTFYTNVSTSLHYKKVSLNGDLSYQRYAYSPILISRSYVPDTNVLLNWELNNQLTLNAGMRYFLGGLRTEPITDSDGYYSSVVQKNIDRSYLINVGFTYIWRNKVGAPQRTKKQLRQTEGGIVL